MYVITNRMESAYMQDDVDLLLLMRERIKLCMSIALNERLFPDWYIFRTVSHGNL